jgi:F-type H+-transporting ATPase subunit b
MFDTMIVLAAEEPSPILPHPEEVILGLVAFGVLFYVIRKYVVPRFENVYQQRTEQIEGGLQRAEAAQAEANQLLEQYQAQLAEAKTEASRIRDDARADAEGIRNDVLAQAREEADRIINAGRDALAAERTMLVRELRAEIGTLAVDLAGKIVGDSLADAARRAGTVERFLADLESAELASPNGDSAVAGAR